PAARTKADRKVAARTRAAASQRASAEPVDLRVLNGGDDFDEDSGDEGEVGTVIPFGVFDAAAEAERWL
uniref:hypothetical protein n=1 Tax=Rhodococcus qingshengii TaxID=334542 RepID=UPI00355740C9